MDLYSAGVPVVMSTLQSPNLAFACAEAGLAYTSHALQKALEDVEKEEEGLTEGSGRGSLSAITRSAELSVMVLVM